jgi:hypothetical protein
MHPTLIDSVMTRLRCVRTLALAAFVAACGNDATSTVDRAGRFQLVQGPPVVALPGYPVADSITVRLVDREGRAMAHTPVTWVAGTGTASGSDQTDADGYAAVEWTLGSETGSQELEVRTLQDSTLAVSITAEFFRAERLATTYDGGCAVLSGDLWCWGSLGGSALTSRRNVSRLLIGDHYYPVDSRPARVTEGESFVDVRLSGQMICGLRADGAVGCLPASWGDSMPAVETLAGPALRNMSGAGAHGSYICGLALSDSTPWCWNGSRVPAQIAGAPPLLDLAGTAGFTTGDAGCGRQVDSIAWCWGLPAPTAEGSALRTIELSVNTTSGCGLRAAGEVWCWTWSLGSIPPVATKVAEGVGSISGDDNITLGVRNGRLIRWEQANSPVWSMTPVTTVATRLFDRLPRNAAYGIHDASGAVYVGGEHYYTNNSGYYNDQYWPLQPVDP